jgi:hypothetical protein
MPDISAKKKKKKKKKKHKKKAVKRQIPVIFRHFYTEKTRFVSVFTYKTQKKRVLEGEISQKSHFFQFFGS